MTNMNRLKRRIEQALYSLKREYGGSIDIYQLISSDTNSRTGETTIVKTVHPVQRAIILPGTVARREIRGISLISANKQLVQGGHWESVDKIFILSSRDLTFDPNTDDWIVYESQKFKIDKVQRFEFDSGLIIWGKAVIGDVPEQVHQLRAENWLHLEVENDGES
ncbi:MAG: hypothetical protein KDA84_09495 [Planctomycetaceae bacterium]|nr:hypothetical protein [Planctomycetaceae bacterium]